MKEGRTVHLVPSLGVDLIQGANPIDVAVVKQVAVAADVRKVGPTLDSVGCIREDTGNRAVDTALVVVEVDLVLEVVVLAVVVVVVGPAAVVVAALAVALAEAFENFLAVEEACLAALGTAVGSSVVGLLAVEDTHTVGLRTLAVAFYFVATHRCFHRYQSLSIPPPPYSTQTLIRGHSLLGPTNLHK